MFVEMKNEKYWPTESELRELAFEGLKLDRHKWEVVVIVFQSWVGTKVRNLFTKSYIDKGTDYKSKGELQKAVLDMVRESVLALETE